MNLTINDIISQIRSYEDDKEEISLPLNEIEKLRTKYLDGINLNNNALTIITQREYTKKFEIIIKTDYEKQLFSSDEIEVDNIYVNWDFENKWKQVTILSFNPGGITLLKKIIKESITDLQDEYDLINTDYLKLQRKKDLIEKHLKKFEILKDKLKYPEENHQEIERGDLTKRIKQLADEFRLNEKDPRLSKVALKIFYTLQQEGYSTTKDSVRSTLVKLEYRAK